MTSVISQARVAVVVSKKLPYPLVRVDWIDAETSQGWEHPDEEKPTVPEVVTVGFLIKESEDVILIASTIGHDRSHNSRISIPRGMVKNITVLKKS